MSTHPPAATPRTLPRPAFAPTRADIILASHHLRRLLPAELVLQILHSASYYPRATTVLPRVLTVSSASGRSERYVGVKAILVSAPIPAAATTVRTVRWWLQARDQGWSGEPEEHKGTFYGSWTWFEAAVYRGVGRCALEDRWRREGVVNVTDREEIVYPEEGFEEVEVDGRRRWLVQRNRNSVKEMGEYVVEWRYGEEGEGAEGGDVETEMRVGCGNGAGFVETLRPGDRVVLLARAMYPGWVNHVAGAQCEIEFATADL